MTDKIVNEDSEVTRRLKRKHYQIMGLFESCLIHYGDTIRASVSTETLAVFCRRNMNE
jgi:hypothetical protein